MSVSFGAELIISSFSQLDVSLHMRVVVVYLVPSGIYFSPSVVSSFLGWFYDLSMYVSFHRLYCCICRCTLLVTTGCRAAWNPTHMQTRYIPGTSTDHSFLHSSTSASCCQRCSHDDTLSSVRVNDLLIRTRKNTKRLRTLRKAAICPFPRPGHLLAIYYLRITYYEKYYPIAFGNSSWRRTLTAPELLMFFFFF